MLRRDAFHPPIVSTVATVDLAELARFEAFADEWWKPNGKFETVYAFNTAGLGAFEIMLPTRGGTIRDVEQQFKRLKRPVAMAGTRAITQTRPL